MLSVLFLPGVSRDMPYRRIVSYRTVFVCEADSFRWRIISYRTVFVGALYLIGQFSLALFVLGLLCVDQVKNRLSNFVPRKIILSILILGQLSSAEVCPIRYNAPTKTVL